jgi:putative hydrolase of the HAD superfamily
MVLLAAPRPRWIVFDAVGTLLYPDPPAAAVYHALAAHYGSRLTLAQVARKLHEQMHPRPARRRRAGLRSRAGEGCLAAERIGRALLWRPRTSQRREWLRWQKIVARVLDDVPGAGGRRLFAQLWHHFQQPEHWQLYPEVASVLTRLKQAGYRLAVASNFDRRLGDVLRGHPPLACLDAVFVSSELGFSKPDPRFFRAIERQVHANGPALLLVGDQVICDVAGALACGWQALLVDRHGHGALAAIRSLEDLGPRLAGAAVIPSAATPLASACSGPGDSRRSEHGRRGHRGSDRDSVSENGRQSDRPVEPCG